MRLQALVNRILHQFMRDKRTLALMLLAPLFILSLLWIVFEQSTFEPTIGAVGQGQIIKSLPKDVEIFSTKESGSKAIKHQDIDGLLLFESPKSITLVVEGSDQSKTQMTIKHAQSILKKKNGNNGIVFQTDYLYGSASLGQFDSFGPVLLGFFIFFFVFLISGISFLRERSSGTLERLLTTPLRIWEMVLGYVIGFGIIAVIQAALISWYTIYVLGMLMTGQFFYVIIVILLLSFTALTLGIFLSAFARNELQMIQFIPIVIVPQLFFSGLFQLESMSKWISWIAPLTPIYYAANALRDVMIRGKGWESIQNSVFVLFGFSVLFILLNMLALRKYRKL